MLAYIIAGILIFWGLYGILKKRMIAPWALRARGRYEMEATKNIPFFQHSQTKNYFIYGTWAVVEGIFLVTVGLIVIIVNS